MKTLIRLLVIAGLLLALPTTVLAQSSPNQINPANATGIQPYNMYGGVRENINLMNGNVNLQVPLLTLPGRNGLDLGVGLEYDSKTWALHWETNEFGEFWWWDNEVRTPQIGTGPWRLSVPVLNATWRKIAPTQTTYCWMDFIITLGDGSKHSFKNRATCYKKIGTQWTSVPSSNISVTDSEDAAYMRLDTTSGSNVVVYLKDGTRIHFSTTFGNGGDDSGVPYTKIGNKIVDSDGNFITITSSGDGIGTGEGAKVNSITDTVGRVVNFTWNAGQLTTVTYSDSGGTPRNITLAHSGVTINPSFTNPAGALVYNTGSWQMLSSITLPNGLTYSFEYTLPGNNFGELTKIKYPTGGYTSYTYAAYTHWYEMWQSSSTEADFREVTSRRVCREEDSTCAAEDVTTYTPTIDGTKTSNEYMDVRDADPVPNRTRHKFSFSLSTGANRNYSPRELQRWIYAGESTLLRTVQTDYDPIATGGYPENWALPIRSTTTLNDTNQVTKTEYTYDTYTHLPDNVSRNIDNPTEVREYAFGSGAAGALVRKTVNIWLKVNFNGYNYHSTAIHILDRKEYERVYDAAGVMKAETEFEYDWYSEGLTGSGAVQHESSFGTSYTTRGNLTAIGRWRNTDGFQLVTRNQYDDAGNLRKTTDPLTHNTTFSYTDSWANSTCAVGTAKAYLTSATNHVGHTTTSTYNSCSGTVASTTDPNNQTTQFSYDLMGRLTVSTLPPTQGGQGQTTRTYNEGSMPLSVTTTTKIDVSKNLVSTVIVDGLGRVTQSRLESDTEGWVYVNTTYDALGRKKTVTNPFRLTSDPTYGITTFEYDGLSRVTKVKPPDHADPNNVVITTYSGNTTIVTDQAGKKRKSETDALGRLSRVWEPNAAGSLVNETVYSYDVLDNLLTVLQSGSRNRTFTYNSLSQLLSAVNPEVGAASCSSTVSYVYDLDGNLTSKTGPLPNQTSCTTTVTTTYNYDGLHRLTSKFWSNEPTGMSITYDQSSVWGVTVQNPIGRAVLVNRSFPTANVGNIYSYDAMGRVLFDLQVNQLQTPNIYNNQTFNYTWNLDGSLANYTNGRGITFTQTYNGAGRITQLTSSWNDSQHPGTLASNITYHPHGAVKKMTLGNGLTETAAYTNRLQPCRMNVNSSGALLTQCTDAVPGGNVLDFNYGFAHGTADNGNVMTWAAVGQQSFSRSYTYDELNRIKTMTGTGGSCTGLSWSYDVWGNRTNQTVTGGTCTMSSLSFNTKNQISNAGFVYDAAGNLINEPGKSYQYDAENRMTSVNGGSTATYDYGPNGERVRKQAGGVTTYFFRDLAGQVLTELWPNNDWKVGYIYLNGQLLAQYGNGTTYFAHKDHLGSTRLLTKLDQSVQECTDYLPFGEQRTDTCLTAGASTTTHKFTGHERDGETGLDYMGARYYPSNYGRLQTPDDFTNDSYVSNPQSWNLYAYARNNPLKYVDPTGQKADVSQTCTTDENNQKTCNVTISASIAIYAEDESVTQAELEEAQKAIETQIEDAWKGTVVEDGITYNVTTDVTVTVAESEDAALESAAQNVIGINKSGNTEVPHASAVDYVFGGPDRGKLDLGDIKGGTTVAHEFSHLLGLNDNYGNVLSNTNCMDGGYCMSPRATQQDLRWALGPDLFKGKTNFTVGAAVTPLGWRGNRKWWDRLP